MFGTQEKEVHGMPRATWGSVPPVSGIVTSAESPYVSVLATGPLGAEDCYGIAVVLEPLQHRPETADAARHVRALLEQAVWHNNGHTTLDQLGDLLTQAFNAANQWLAARNAGRPLDEWCRFGAACALFRGADLLIAQVVPSHVLVSQEQEIYAFPGEEHARAGGDAPLGQASEVSPALYYTRLAPGDTVVLCHHALGTRLLECCPEAVASPDPERILALLEELAWERGDSTVHAVAIAIEHAGSGATRPFDRLTRLLRQLFPDDARQRLASQARTNGGAVTVDLEGATRQTSGGGDGDDAEDDWGDWGEEPYRAAGDEAAGDPRSHSASGARWEPHGHLDDAAPHEVEHQSVRSRTLVELLAGLAMAVVVAAVGVWQLLTRRRRRLAPPPDDGTFGLPRLQKFDDEFQFPDFTPIRRQLPRLPVSRMTGLVAVSLIGLLTTALAVSIHNDRERARQERFETLVQTAVQERTLAQEADDPVIARAYLSTASARLDAAAEIGLDPERIAAERAALRAAVDQVLKIHRLESVQLLGGVPPAPEGVTPRIFFGNGQLYLLTDALYRLDSSGTRLIKLLEPGMEVGGEPVGTLLGAAWGEGAPIAFDGAAAYVLDPATAQWHRLPVGTFGAPYTGVVAVNGFAGNLYLLLPEPGQILKFLAGSYENAPEDWTGGQFVEQLVGAVDMEIDGRIYVLQPDGSIATFFRGALESDLTPQLDPPLTEAVALAMQPDRPYRYVADRHGRIVQLDQNGELVRQFVSAEGVPPLGPIRDIAVDDILGVAYVLTDQALLSVRLPASPAGQ